MRLREIVLGGETIRALDGVSFTIESGEVLAIIGPSGSGKSTLMNLLGCLQTPTSGGSILEGRRVSDLSEEQLAQVRNHRIGFVFQSFNLLPRPAARENVALLRCHRRCYRGITDCSCPRRGADEQPRPVSI